MIPRRLSVLLLLSIWQPVGAVPAECPPSATQDVDRSVPVGVQAGVREIGTLAELRRAMAADHQRVRMKPGVYRVTDAAPDNRTVFLVTGSDNHFDLRGVTLQVDTQVLADLRGGVHSLATYRVLGSRITFEGGRFENTGDHPPFQSLSEFTVAGDDVTFRHCRFLIRGSAPYGYGDLYGKGAGAAVRLQKHSAIHVTGDRTLIEDCDFRIHTFGHGIHVHGAQDTVIRNVTMEGELRRTCDLYDEADGLAARFDYQMRYPPWHSGRAIPRNRMLSLTEDGIRAYVYGNDREGNRRRTGHITVENCTVKRMRGGITICMAASGTITDCTVLDSGGYAYSVPSDGVVRNCRGNAAYGPLLVMPYKQHRRADIELELLDAPHEKGDHPLARITGDGGHRIRIEYTGEQAPKTLRPILLGSAGDRYTEDNTDPRKLRYHHVARRVRLENRTPHPVRLTRYSAECHVASEGPVEDDGEDNKIKQVGAGRY